MSARESSRNENPSEGFEALRANRMMSHLLDSLAAGTDIGHFGRLVFTMVARHFMSEEEVCEWLAKDPAFSEEEAAVLWKQVEAHDYNPPRPNRILEWQREQEFPICPDAATAECNVYRDLKFPDKVYEHIQQFYQQQ